MKKLELTNWIAMLGVGSGVAFHTDASAQEAPRDTRAEAVRTLDAAALANAVLWAAPVYVVINHEEQYSIWPEEMPIPRGWRQVEGDMSMESAATRLASRVGKLRFQVVINHEEQYSIWPMSDPVPEGFKTVAEGCAIVECAKQVKG